MTLSSSRCLLAGILALIGVQAHAADLGALRSPPPAPAYAEDPFATFQLRLKASAVIPDGKTTVYDTYGAVLPVAGLSHGSGGVVTYAGATYSKSVIPEVDFAYFFTRNISVEAMCCATRNTVTGTGSIAGLPVGSTWALPATLLFQYHFTNFGAFQPYVGIGGHYTFFPFTTASKSWQPFFAPAFGSYFGFYQAQSLKISSAMGVVGQLGFDYMITPTWGFNFDVKRYLLEPTGYVTVVNNLAGIHSRPCARKYRSVGRQRWHYVPVWGFGRADRRALLSGFTLQGLRTSRARRCRQQADR